MLRAVAPVAVVGVLLAGCGGGTTTVVADDQAAVATFKGYDDVSVAAREAAKTGRPVELTKLRTSSERTFIRPDGQTLIERKDSAGKVSREVRNTPAVVLFDQRAEPRHCNPGDGRRATSLTPTLSVTVADPDRRVHDSKVRTFFEVTESQRTVASGYSEWVESGSRTSWTVPAGVFQDGRAYTWRARAEDGESTSEWAAWERHYFRVDLAYDPEYSCGGDDIGLFWADVDFARSALADLVEARPDRYQDPDAGPYGIGLYAVRRPGASDADVIAEARADGQRAVMAAPAREGVTDELRRRAADAVTIELVDFRADEMWAAYEEIDARVGRRDPTLPPIADLGVLTGEHGGGQYVGVFVRGSNPAQERALANQYPGRVRIERIPAEPGHWSEYECRKAFEEINARRKAKDPTLPKILIAWMPPWDNFAYVKVAKLSDPRAKALQEFYGARIRVDDGSNLPHFGENGAPDDAW